jgi:N-acetylglutamate synthase-like GNAT family acetyltransferase
LAAGAVSVRVAVREDVPSLVTLWEQLRDEGLRRRNAVAESPEAAATRFEVALEATTSRVVVAVFEDQIIGMAQLSRTPPTLLAEASSLELTAMHVAHGHRRRGAGKALLSYAVSYAEEIGVENVVVSVFTQHRDFNRFFARLGFAPLVTRRVASVTSLRRRLGTPEGRAALLRREIHVPRRAAISRTRRHQAVTARRD